MLALPSSGRRRPYSKTHGLRRRLGPALSWPSSVCLEPAWKEEDARALSLSLSHTVWIICSLSLHSYRDLSWCVVVRRDWKRCDWLFRPHRKCSWWDGIINSRRVSLQVRQLRRRRRRRRVPSASFITADSIIIITATQAVTTMPGNIGEKKAGKEIHAGIRNWRRKPKTIFLLPSRNSFRWRLKDK